MVEFQCTTKITSVITVGHRDCHCIRLCIGHKDVDGPDGAMWGELGHYRSPNLLGLIARGTLFSGYKPTLRMFGKWLDAWSRTNKSSFARYVVHRYPLLNNSCIRCSIHQLFRWLEWLFRGPLQF